MFFFFNDTATTEIYTLSLHDALPISFENTVPSTVLLGKLFGQEQRAQELVDFYLTNINSVYAWVEQIERDNKVKPLARSEEHTSELQSRQYLVCRLLLEKKNHIYISL